MLNKFLFKPIHYDKFITLMNELNSRGYIVNNQKKLYKSWLEFSFDNSDPFLDPSEANVNKYCREVLQDKNHKFLEEVNDNK